MRKPDRGGQRCASEWLARHREARARWICVNVVRRSIREQLSAVYIYWRHDDVFLSSTFAASFVPVERRGNARARAERGFEAVRIGTVRCVVLFLGPHGSKFGTCFPQLPS